MATMITDECINCGACEPECPNEAIYQGGVEYVGLDGTKHPALSKDFFYIVPEKCTECVGFFDQEACAAVCPVDCCIPDPERIESEDALAVRAKQIHPEKDFSGELPSRFRKVADAGAAATAGASAAASGAAISGTIQMAMPVMSAEDALAAKFPLQDDWEVPLTCFRCTGRFAVPLLYLRPGTVLHCPHCGGSYVPNTQLYQSVQQRVTTFFEAWGASFDDLRERRRRELDRFENDLVEAFEKARTEIDKLTAKPELPGAPTRQRGIFG